MIDVGVKVGRVYESGACRVFVPDETIAIGPGLAMRIDRAFQMLIAATGRSDEADIYLEMDGSITFARRL